MVASAKIKVQIEDIIGDISRLRQRLDEMILPLSEPKRDLAMHLAMAELAAVRFRIESAEDDEVVVVDS